MTLREDLIAARSLIDAARRFMEFVSAHSDEGEVVPHHTIEHERLRAAIAEASRAISSTEEGM